MASRFTPAHAGVSAPNSGRDAADYDMGTKATGTYCVNCGHSGHKHDKVRVYGEDSPPGYYHYEYRCPGGGD